MYRKFASLIYRTALGVLGNREDADDVVQTVFIALMRRDSLPAVQNPKAYLYKAAITASLNVLRVRRRRPILVDDAVVLEVPAPSPSSSFDEEAYERLSEALERISALTLRPCCSSGTCGTRASTKSPGSSVCREPLSRCGSFARGPGCGRF
jgi:RNA polymerase sigma factor (sigma-70 family)